jgi:hypothetical protein
MTSGLAKLRMSCVSRPTRNQTRTQFFRNTVARTCNSLQKYSHYVSNSMEKTPCLQTSNFPISRDTSVLLPCSKDHTAECYLDIVESSLNPRTRHFIPTDLNGVLPSTCRTSKAVYRFKNSDQRSTHISHLPMTGQASHIYFTLNQIGLHGNTGL